MILECARTEKRMKPSQVFYSLELLLKLFLFVNFRGSNSAEGGTYQLADMYRRCPNPLADMDRGVHIRGESKSAVTPGFTFSAQLSEPGLESETKTDREQ
jgi:hypothetical protein